MQQFAQRLLVFFREASCCTSLPASRSLHRLLQASDLKQKNSGYFQMAFFRPILSNDALLDASQLRTALRGAGVNTRRWTENVMLNWTVAEMRDLYHRLRQENVAEQEVAVWARSRNCGSAQPSVPSRCIAFWHCVAKRVGESRKVLLPESFQIGLTSATRYFLSLIHI